jgi:hypothetical protein
MIGGMSENIMPGGAASAADEPLACLRCGGEMTQGFLIDNGHNFARSVAEWTPGPPKRSFWTGIKRAAESLPVGAFRCTACGRLELFADKVFGLR